MKIKAGLWIDHRKAIIMTIGENGEKIEQVLSNVEKQLRRTGDSPMKGPFERRAIPEEDSRLKMYVGQLNGYYDAVIARIRDAESIFIFGPGEAKDELKARLEEAHLDSRITGIETADKMTDPQIAIKVRKQFAG
jgi:hypothetical protein